MKLAFRLIACTLLFGSAIGVGVCGGSTPQPAQSAGTQPTILSELLKDWQRQKTTMMTIADAMPEDKLGFKTTPPQRTYGEQILHIAQVNMGILKVIGGKSVPPAFAPQNAKTKADVMKAMSDSYDYGTALLQEQTDATIIQTIQAPAFLGPSTRARIFWFLMGHSMDIYGQMAIYLRLNGIVPPASRGV